MTSDPTEKPIKHPGKEVSTSDASGVRFEVDPATNAEGLVDAAAAGFRVWPVYARFTASDAPYFGTFDTALDTVWVREGLVERLQAADASLAHEGLALQLLDGYRPIAFQQELWRWFLAEAARRTEKPETDTETIQLAQRYCSNPAIFKEDDPTSFPLHYSGGAVDVRLVRREDGWPVDMGGIFDDPSDVSTTTWFEDRPCDTAADKAARRHRRLLFWAMIDAGFVNMASEWWHYEYGSRTWCQALGYDRLLYAAPPGGLPGAD